MKAYLSLNVFLSTNLMVRFKQKTNTREGQKPVNLRHTTEVQWERGDGAYRDWSARLVET